MFIARHVVRFVLVGLALSAVVLVSAVYLARATPTRVVMVTERLAARNRDQYNNVFLVDLERCARIRLPLIALEDTLAWSPNGDLIAFLSRSLGGIEIYTADWRGTDMRKISDNFTQDTHLAFSPSGESLAFTAGLTDQFDVAVIDLTQSRSQSAVFNVSDSDEPAPITPYERILTPPISVEVSPAWSPDGRFMVYSAAGGQADTVAAPGGAITNTGHFELFLLDLETEQVTQLTAGLRWNFSPTWSPDGDQITYVSFDFESEEDQQSHYAISTIDVNINAVTGEIRASAPRDLFELHGTVLLEPAYTPDGAEIAFMVDGARGQEIHIMGVNGENYRHLPCMSGNISAFAFRP